MMRFAYADPPYPGNARYYADHPDGGRGEVDHVALIEGLRRDFPDGWALSTSSGALRSLLPLCPPTTRVCVWRRRVRYARSTRALSAWEPLLVVGGRALRTDAPHDLIDCLETGEVVLEDPDDEVLDYRGRYASFPGNLVGMKPPEFAAWTFRLLGARPGDDLVDVFPGSGAIGTAWDLYTADPSHLQPGDPSRLRVPSTRSA